MFTVTETAQEQIKDFFKENAVRPIRLFLSSGCGGNQLLLALDDKRPSDETFPVAGFEFIIEKALLDRAQPVHIDFGEKGFIIDSPLKPASGCTGCGSSENCCG